MLSQALARVLLASSWVPQVAPYNIDEIFLPITDEETGSSEFKELAQVRQLLSGRAGVGTLTS